MRAPLALLLLTSCGGVAASTPPPRPCPTAEAPPPTERAAPAALEITVRAFEDPAAPLEVTTASLDGAAAWSAREGFEALEASDAQGPLETVIEGGRVGFERAIAPPLHLRYRLPPPGSDDEHRGQGRGRTYFDGGALLLPEGARETSIRVALEVGLPGVDRVVSTLDEGPSQTLEAPPEALRDVVWALGRADLARFETRDGFDVVASVGGRRFDTRWVAAELALLRSDVSTWFGQVSPGAHYTVIVSRPAIGRAPPFSAARSGRGLRLVAREDAEWSSEARLPVAQVLVRRWLAGAFVGDDGEAEAWLGLGASRWIAQSILTRMGTLTSEELARDLTMLEGVVALAEPGEATPLERMAHGALYAAALDARLRAHGGDEPSFRRVLLPLMREADDTGAPVPRTTVVAALQRILGDAEVTRFEAQALGADPVELPADAFGPCLRPRTTTHRRFALGFTAPPMGAETIEVTGVDPSGPAYRAGLRDGMVIRDLRYVPGDAETDVELEVVETGARLRFRPSDRSARGRGWVRVPRLDEDDCFGG